MGLDFDLILSHPIRHQLPMNMGQVIFLDVKSLQCETIDTVGIETRNPSLFGIGYYLNLTGTEYCELF